MAFDANRIRLQITGSILHGGLFELKLRFLIDELANLSNSKRSLRDLIGNLPNP